MSTIVKTNKQPKLTLVGAGPGDPELITVKGIKAIQDADVILYDALASEELLLLAKRNAVKISVGKRKGSHSYKQEDINQLIVSYAFTYGHVVRLKGGDPFVFGRGFEEIQFAEAFGIETTYVPGISSSIAVAGMSGIPVTHRGAANSFWVLTATNKNGELSPEIKLAAQSNSTVVILMGLSKIYQIADVFARYGKEDEAVAVIQNGTLPDERIVVSTYKNIGKEVARHNIKPPAIIISGKVVKEQNDYFGQLALSRILNNGIVASN
ncbi:MAG TPA: uroporphyrinogen-III C-methyltransferase [Flavobacteriales bacterium]|nr:uroporphyrinogen-III C-methyltransferase [Flavobacteriales bacterium]